MNQSNQGFVNLHNDTGVLLVTMAAMLMLGFIVMLVFVAKSMEHRGREEREALKRDQQTREEPNPD